MKYILLLVQLICIKSFSQSVEMRQLLINIEKLAQMKAQYQTMIQGYRTLEHGYQQINSLAKGNFLLHRDYLEGLLAVSPAVQQYGRINAIVQQHKNMVAQYHLMMTKMRTGSLLKPTELNQCKSSMVLLINRSSGALDEMMDVLTPGRMRMNDEERISVINRLDEEVRSLALQLDQIVARYQGLSAARVQNQRDVKALKLIYGIKS